MELGRLLKEAAEGRNPAEPRGAAEGRPPNPAVLKVALSNQASRVKVAP